MKTKEFTTLQPADAAKAAQSLVRAFQWPESKEGDVYWRQIYDRLVDISHQKEIRSPCPTCGRSD